MTGSLDIRSTDSTDNTTGLKLSHNNGIAFIDYGGSGNLHFRSTNSSKRITLLNNGRVGISNVSPSYKLDVDGDIRCNDELYVTNKVGIGTTSPTEKLDVDGIVKIRSSSGNDDIIIGTTIVQNTNAPLAYMRANGSGSLKFSVGWNQGTGIEILSDNKLYFEKGIDLSDSRSVAQNVPPEVDQIKVISVSLTLNTITWTDVTGVEGDYLATGTYIVQVYSYDAGAGGGNYTEYYSGVMAWYDGGTNSNEGTEIFLHASGHAPNNRPVYLRTLRHPSSNTHDVQLQMKKGPRNGYSMSAATYTLRFRRMI